MFSPIVLFCFTSLLFVYSVLHLDEPDTSLHGRLDCDMILNASNGSGTRWERKRASSLTILPASFVHPGQLNGSLFPQFYFFGANKNDEPFAGFYPQKKTHRRVMGRVNRRIRTRRARFERRDRSSNASFSCQSFLVPVQSTQHRTSRPFTSNCWSLCSGVRHFLQVEAPAGFRLRPSLPGRNTATKLRRLPFRDCHRTSC